MKYCFCVPQLPMSIVEFVDIVEGWDPHERGTSEGTSWLDRHAASACRASRRGGGQSAAVGWRLADGEFRALGRTFDGVAAAGGAVDCLGIMPGRPDRVFKVNSRPMEPARAVQALERLRWRGPAGEVAAFLLRFEGLFRTLRLAVGVSADGVLPRIGLELFQAEAASLSHPGAGKWPPFLARLHEEGLCLPLKMEGLLAWPRRELVFCGRDTFGVLTGIANMKVSFERFPLRRGKEAPRSRPRPIPPPAISPSMWSRRDSRCDDLWRRGHATCRRTRSRNGLSALANSS